jgi:hypothetical protein
MGLDMYLGGVCENGKPNGEQPEPLLFSQWRKHWPLHEYLASQFAGGMDEYGKTHFLSIRLSAIQLQKVIAAIEAGELKSYPGESAYEDITVFQTALAWLEASEGETRAVYYEAND